MKYIMFPLYTVLYCWLAMESTVKWIVRGLLWIGIFTLIGFAHYAVSYVTESYWPASILYGVILAAAYIRYRLDR